VSEGVAAIAKVCAVVVTYRPRLESLAAALDSVQVQVQALVVVDNASPDAAALAAVIAGRGATLLGQDSNVGLARAQNIGIEWAREHGFSHVLILDQDSVPAPDMAQQLLAALQRTGARRRVAAAGPRFHDPREGRDYPFISVGFPRSTKLWCDAGNPDIETDFLISSGSLIPLAVIDEIGTMDEGLFIDNVDMEWSFRARSKGFVLLGVCGAVMTHELGDDRQSLLGYAQVVHGPVRLYYIMRNRVLLYRLPYTPRIWIAQDLLRLPVKFLIFSVLVAPRLRNTRYMLRGLWDALRSRRGPCPLEAS
jgi:rhamnosyltransferase